MSQLTRSEMDAFINQYLPTNNQRYITAAILRAVLDNMVDSVILWYDEKAGTINIADKAITNDKLRDSLAFSVIGRSSQTDGSPADIQATVNGQILVLIGNELKFGQAITESLGDGIVKDAKVFTPPTPADGIDGEKLKVKYDATAFTVPRTVGDKSRDYFNIKDAGAVGNGVADDSPAFPRAISALNARSGNRGGKILLDSLPYALGSKIVLPSWVFIEGAGGGVSRLIPTYTNDDVVTLGNGSATVAENCGISNLSIEPAAQMVSGSLIRFRNHFWATVDEVRMPINANINISIDKGPTAYLAFINKASIFTGTYGILVGDEGSGFCQGVTINECDISNSTLSGLHITTCGGIYVTGATEFLRCNVSVSTFPGVGQVIKALQMTGAVLDSADGINLNLITNGGEVTDCSFEQTWFSSAGFSVPGSHNVSISQGSGRIDGIAFTGCRNLNASGRGWSINSGKNLDWTGCQTFCNSQQGSAIWDGYTFSPGVSDWSIKGGRVGLGGEFIVNNQRYGIAVATGASQNYTIDTATTGNVTAGIFDGGSNFAKRIASNAGCVTSNTGQSVLPTGQSSVVINHGLDFTPSPSDIYLTDSVQRSAAGITELWVSAATATTFTVTANTAATANFFFGWSARVKGA